MFGLRLGFDYFVLIHIFMIHCWNHFHIRLAFALSLAWQYFSIFILCYIYNKKRVGGGVVERKPFMNYYVFFMELEQCIILKPPSSFHQDLWYFPYIMCHMPIFVYLSSFNETFLLVSQERESTCFDVSV